MAIDQTKWVENITEWLSWAIWDISKKLKNLMDQIMWPINKILEDLWFKEKVETQLVVDKSKIDLNKLMKHIKNKEDEKAIELINKSEVFKETVKRLNNDDFGKKTKEKELNWILSLFKEKLDDKNIDEKELNWILWQVKVNRKFIEEEDKNKDISKSGISFIIKQINENEETEEDYSIKEIISAYKIVKQEVEDWKNIILDKSSILIELEKLEK